MNNFFCFIFLFRLSLLRGTRCYNLILLGFFQLNNVHLRLNNFSWRFFFESSFDFFNLCKSPLLSSSVTKLHFFMDEVSYQQFYLSWRHFALILFSENLLFCQRYNFRNMNTTRHTTSLSGQITTYPCQKKPCYFCHTLRGTFSALFLAPQEQG